MRDTLRTVVCAGVVACAVATGLAFLPPVEERAGVRVAIDAADAPRAFSVSLSNTTAAAVSGRLAVWMNDDWEVAGEQGALTLPPHEARTRAFSGAAKARAIDEALYPVHARFTPEGVAEDAAPHPIAVFTYKNPQSTRVAQAIAAARRARADGTDAAAGRYRLDAGDGEVYGAAVVRGPRGLVDGVIAFSDGARAVAFRGFAAETTTDGTPAPAPDAQVYAEKGTLRLKWSIPGVTRNAQGFPRITRLAPGPATEKLTRVYAGFGSVLEGPKEFTLESGGFQLTTRHVGADYENGLSVVQAVDVPPDRLVCKGKENLFSLEAHHDALYTFAPSRRGAFAAARQFRAVSGYRASAGHARLGSRMCLNQEYGDYGMMINCVRTCAKYGLDDALLVEHSWSRWGYDCRYPDICPPGGDRAAFATLRAACREANMLFLLHDNYTDFYPDATDFSYDLITFNLDGTPQKAWYNPGTRSLSYRWAPHAYLPWCRRNAFLLRDDCAPDGVFIDVFTALAPYDYLDRKGNFHTKSETSQGWGRGFEAYREALGADALGVSEAGMDHLVGVADAGQSDHYRLTTFIGPGSCAVEERTPWHDIATHNYFVLFAGGIGWRYMDEWPYGGKDDEGLHSYASDDYLSITALGGRNPMCSVENSPPVIMTYWLQHDTCAELGAAEFLGLTFEGSIHRQHAVFSNGGNVWCNRQKGALWTLPNGWALPTYGYYAKTATTESGIIERNGVRGAFSKTPTLDFYDARKPRMAFTVSAETSVARVEKVASDGIRLVTAWNLKRSLRNCVPMVHVCRTNETTKKIEIVACPSKLRLPAESLTRTGRFEAPLDVTIPADLPAGTYTVRYAILDPKHSGRMLLCGQRRDEERRTIAGAFTVRRDGGRVAEVTWQTETGTVEAMSEQERARAAQLSVNVAGATIDFGGVKTDGTFRLAHPATGDWRVTPLLGADGFSAELDLAALGRPNARVAAVEALEPTAQASAPTWRQDGTKLVLRVDAHAFAYRIVLK